MQWHLKLADAALGSFRDDVRVWLSAVEARHTVRADLAVSVANQSADLRDARSDVMERVRQGAGVRAADARRAISVGRAARPWRR